MLGEVEWKQIPIIPDLKKAESSPTLCTQDHLWTTQIQVMFCRTLSTAIIFYGRNSAMPEKSNSVPPQQGRLPSSSVHLMPMNKLKMSVPDSHLTSQFWYSNVSIRKPILKNWPVFFSIAQQQMSETKFTFQHAFRYWIHGIFYG